MLYLIYTIASTGNPQPNDITVCDPATSTIYQASRIISAKRRPPTSRKRFPNATQTMSKGFSKLVILCDKRPRSLQRNTEYIYQQMNHFKLNRQERMNVARAFQSFFKRPLPPHAGQPLIPKEASSRFSTATRQQAYPEITAPRQMKTVMYMHNSRHNDLRKTRQEAPRPKNYNTHSSSFADLYVISFWKMNHPINQHRPEITMDAGGN